MSPSCVNDTGVRGPSCDIVSSKSRRVRTSIAPATIVETKVEQTDATKVRRSEAAFVHEVVETDAPNRIDSISEADATDFSWMLTEVREVCQTACTTSLRLSTEDANTAEDAIEFVEKEVCHSDAACAPLLSSAV